MYSAKRNFYYYMLNNIVVGIIPFISIAIFSKVLSPEDYGLYALYLIAGSIFSTIISSGLPAAHEVMFFEQKNYNHKLTLTFSLVIFVILFSVFAFGILYIFDDFILKILINEAYSNQTLYLSCYSSMFSSLNFYFFNHFRNQRDGKSYMIYRTLTSMISLFISIYLILILNYSYEAFFISTLIASLLLFIFFILKFRMNITFISFKMVREAFKIALPLYPKILFGLIRTNYDRILLNNIATQSLVGIYDLGLKASNQGTLIITSLYNSFIPNFYDQLNKKAPGYKTDLPNSLMKFFGVYMSAILLISFFSFEVFYLITPESFHEAINISSIIAVTLSFNFIEHIPILLFLKKTRLITILNVLTSTVILITGLIFGLKFGLYGFIISNLFLSFLSSIMYFIVYQNNLRLNWPIRKITLIYSYLLLSVVTIITFRVIEIEYLYRLILKIFLLTGLIFSFLKLKIFIKEDLYLVLKKINKILISKNHKS